jgi:hypothetical protein
MLAPCVACWVSGTVHVTANGNANSVVAGDMPLIDARLLSGPSTFGPGRLERRLGVPFPAD